MTHARLALVALAVMSAGLARAVQAQRPAETPGANFERIDPRRAGLEPERLARIDRWLDSEVEGKRKAGGLALIARHGKIAYLATRGYADLETRRSFPADAIVRLYSMTKPITSVALLSLYEQGKFRLTDPLENYVPAFKGVKVYAGLDASGAMILEEPKRKITIQDVMRHTAGFTYGYFGDTPIDKAYRAAGIDFEKLDSLQELIDKLAKLPLLYQPGERWVYSVAHDVQAYLVEIFSGMRFDEYCRRTIFEPLGMKDTVFGVPPRLASRFPTSYALKDGVLVANGGQSYDVYARGAEHPFGGLSVSSSATDYLRFAEMLLGRGEWRGARILAPKTVDLMTSDNLPPAVSAWAEGIRYGLGVDVITNPALNGILGTAGEFGWRGLATTSFFVDPKEDLVAILFMQRTPEDYDAVATFKVLVYQSIVK